MPDSYHWVSINGHRAECDCGKYVSDKRGRQDVLEAWAVLHMRRNARVSHA